MTALLHNTSEVDEEEKARRIMAEATRLAGLSPGEWKIWIDGSAERLEITRNRLEAVVREIIDDREKRQREKKADERRSEQRAERSRKEQDRKGNGNKSSLTKKQSAGANSN